MEKSCPIIGCPIQIETSEFMCCTHWKKLSSTLRHRVIGRCKIAEREQCSYKLELFTTALTDAIRFVQSKELPTRTAQPLQAPFHSRFEAELAAYGVSLEPEQLERYRKYFLKHPNGGTLTA